MNNKGFTLVETVLSFALVTVLLVSLVAITVNYREKVENEQMNTMMTEFKTTFTKLVYDDIIKYDYDKINGINPGKEFVSITSCSDNNMCARLNRADGTNPSEIRIVNYTGSSSSVCKGTYGIYLDYYDGSKHNCIFLPDSNRNDPDDLEYIETANDANKIYSSLVEKFNITSNSNAYNLRINIENKTSGYKDYISITINE